MGEPRGIRVGDAERDAVATSLRDHFAHGRLTYEEFHDRLDAALTARTDLDLARITSDLPVSPGPAWPQPDPRRGRPGTGRPGARIAAGVLGLWLAVPVFLMVLIAAAVVTRFLLVPVLIVGAIALLRTSRPRRSRRRRW